MLAGCVGERPVCLWCRPSLRVIVQMATTARPTGVWMTGTCTQDRLWHWPDLKQHAGSVPRPLYELGHVT